MFHCTDLHTQWSILFASCINCLWKQKEVFWLFLSLIIKKMSCRKAVKRTNGKSGKLIYWWKKTCWDDRWEFRYNRKGENEENNQIKIPIDERLVGFDEIVESRLSRLPGCKFYSGPWRGKGFFVGVVLSSFPSRSRWEAAEGGKNSRKTDCSRTAASWTNYSKPQIISREKKSCSICRERARDVVCRLNSFPLLNIIMFLGLIKKQHCGALSSWTRAVDRNHSESERFCRL